jgi:hypothetical protein
MKVCLITATKNRHKHLERVVRFSLDQSYDNWVHLIYNNSDKPLRLAKDLPDRFILINKHVSTKTNLPYQSLGEIYNDIIEFIPDDVDIINFMDDDDVFLENHIEEGVAGIIRGGKSAYKPKKSYYKHGKIITLVENVMEPSIFVKAECIREHGFSDETTAQHLQWVRPLIEKDDFFVDELGKPTYICDWSQEISTYKTSGNPSNPLNFKAYEEWSKDNGDGIITPCSKSWADHYRTIKKVK